MLKGLGKNKIVLCFRNIKIPVKKAKIPKLSLGMGCVCSKGAKDDNEAQKEKKSKKSSKRFVASSRKEEVVVEVENGGNEATARLIVPTENAERSAGSTPAVWEDEDVESLSIDKQWKAGHQIQKRGTVEPKRRQGQPEMCRVLSVKNGVDGAQVVAGWPTWLTSVAGEAIKGWVPRKADSFQRLDKIGQGTYSSVYRARDLETGKIVALKKVRFANMDPESVRFMAREILILRRLDHPNVMKLEGLVISRVSGSLYLVFQYMEHDLAGLLVSPLVRFTEPQIKCFMQQLLWGLKHCHDRGVLHRDIKGSNLLIDNSGNLKIGDFGLATFFRANQTQPLTSRVVTLWYRPPELLLGATDYGVSVDLWSTGCILAELFAGKPIMPGRTEVEQLHKIFKLCGSPSEEYWKTSKLPNKTIFKPQQPYKRCIAETFKDFPPSALSLLESLLAFEPERRGMASSALQSDFFTTKPLPCEPSSLPRYPPSKEFDAKVQDDEARRQRPTSGKEGIYESSRNGHRKTNTIPSPDANAELQDSEQKWKRQPNSTSKIDVYNPKENGVSGLPNERSQGSLRTGSSMLVGISGNALDMDEGRHLNFHRGLDSSVCRDLNTQRSFRPRESAAILSRFSNSVASGGGSRLDLSRDSSVHSHWLGRGPNTGDNDMNDTESTHHLLGRHDSSAYKNNGHVPRKDNVYAFKKSRMHYSGPLLPAGGSIDEMLKEHERLIQVAVRKAQSKNRKGYADNAQTNSLLGFVNSGR